MCETQTKRQKLVSRAIEVNAANRQNRSGEQLPTSQGRSAVGRPTRTASVSMGMSMPTGNQTQGKRFFFYAEKRKK